jgi:hypothetical protein
MRQPETWVLPLVVIVIMAFAPWIIPSPAEALGSLEHDREALAPSASTGVQGSPTCPVEGERRSTLLVIGL